MISRLLPHLRSLGLALYPRLPIFAQNLLCTAEGLRRWRWRYGGAQAEYERFFREAEFWPYERLLEYQDRMLRDLVRFAGKRVPYYRKRWREIGFDYEKFRGIADLEALPILERSDLQAHSAELVAEGWDRSRLWAHPSGGSTGMPITIYTSREAMEFDYGFHWARRRPLVSRQDPFATFSANPIVPSSQDRPPFWRWNYIARQRLFSVFHLSDKNIPYYLAELVERPVVYVHGYPSALYTLAEYCLRNPDANRPTFRVFFSTSEVLLPEWREAIEKAFSCRVFNQYGQGELSASITEYECGRLHVDMDYSIVELRKVGEEDGLVRAEVIGTCLHNRAWPLIRYRVGDEVLYDPKERCGCGRAGQVIRHIAGRTSQYFVLPNGRRITSMMGLSLYCRNAKSIQVIQEREGAIIVHLVPTPSFSQEDKEHLLKVFRSRLGDEIEIEVRLAERPVLTKAGKFLAIINRMGAKTTLRDMDGDQR